MSCWSLKYNTLHLLFQRKANSVFQELFLLCLKRKEKRKKDLRRRMCAECYLSVPGVIHLLSLFFVEKCMLKNGCKDSYSCDLGVTGLFLHTEG